MQKKAERTYMLQFMGSMVVYMVMLMAAVWVVPLVSPMWLKATLAILPALPLGMGLRAYLTFVNSRDELQRLIQLQAVALAAGVTMMVTFVYGLLEALAGFPPISVLWVLPLLVALWGISVAYYSWRYQ